VNDTIAEGTTMSTTDRTTPGAAGSATASHATLRRAEPADLPGVERLLTAAGLPLAGVADALPTFVVAEADGTLVGVAGLERCCDNALLRSVAVDPAWRSHGLGRALVERVIADADSAKVHALYLLTTTAERYFPSFGFREVARDAVPADVRETAEFRGACPASATVMVRPAAGISPPR
jgi:amino-acid N-acetyltransferase